MSEQGEMTIGTATINKPDLRQLAPTGHGWRFWLGLVFSAALFIAIVIEMTSGGLEAFRGALPTTPAFYIAFALGYMTLPVFDWLIFRHLWGLPLAGLTPLIKKRVANDVLFGYSGEGYFYLWLKARPGITAHPFGAIKDVSILSALAGNAMTFALLLAAFPMIGDLTFAIEPQLLLGSGAILIGISLAVLIFRRQLFTLAAPDLWPSFILHLVRITLSTLFLALAWYFALPEVDAAYWVLFAALRLLINRLPLIPSKDLLFAAAAIFLTDKGDAMGNVVAMSAGLFLATNLAFGILLTGTDFIGRRRS
ncbi:MAG: hypothetical protein WA979_05885 [Pacificimonas sp.]